MKWLLYIVFLFSGLVNAQSADSLYHHPDHPAVFTESNGNPGNWLIHNINWPDSIAPAHDDVRSTIQVSFVVEKDGRLSEIRVAHGGTPEQNRHIASVIKSMPRWKPATHQGAIVRSAVVLSIHICLK